MTTYTPKDFSSLDTYRLYEGITSAILNQLSSSSKKQTRLIQFIGGGDDLELNDKTKVSINVLTGSVTISIFDLEGVLIDSYNRDSTESVLDFSAFGSPINNILIQGAAITDTCEIVYTDK